MTLETEKKLLALARYLHLNMSSTTKQSFIAKGNEIFLRVSLIAILRSSKIDTRLHENLKIKIVSLIIVEDGVPV